MRTITQLTRRSRSDEGFTLVELLVVVAVIGILAAVAIPTYLAVRNSAIDATSRSDLANFEVAASRYASDHGGSYSGLSFDALTASPYNFTPSADEPEYRWSVSVAADGGSYFVGVCALEFGNPGTGHIFVFSSQTGTTTTA